MHGRITVHNVRSSLNRVTMRKTFILSTVASKRANDLILMQIFSPLRQHYKEYFVYIKAWSVFSFNRIHCCYYGDLC